jgi:hypothetical protein
VIGAIGRAAEATTGFYIIRAINGSIACPVTNMDTVVDLERELNERPILYQTNAAITVTANEDKRVPLNQPVFVYPDYMMQVAPVHCLLVNCLLADPVKEVDVSRLRDNMLLPVLGISNAEEGDPRIRYFEGTRALTELSTPIDQGAFKAVIVQFSPSVKRILDITDLGRTMPEKSFLMITEPDPQLNLSALR